MNPTSTNRSISKRQAFLSLCVVAVFWCTTQSAGAVNVVAPKKDTGMTSNEKVAQQVFNVPKLVFAGFKFEQKAFNVPQLLFAGHSTINTAPMDLDTSKLLKNGPIQSKATKVFGNKTAAPGSESKTLAKVTPQNIGSKLVLQDAGSVKVIKLTEGTSSEAIFAVINSSDSPSAAMTYSVACQKLSNAASKCPAFQKRGALGAIGPQASHDITIRLMSVVAGKYELTLKLANGEAQTLKLDVAAAKPTVTPGTSTSTSITHPPGGARRP